MSLIKRGAQRSDFLKAVIFGVLFVFIALFFSSLIWAADPVGPDTLTSVSNSSKGTVSAKIFNISGGNISTFNLDASVQDIRWKGFVGNVTGKYTLDDAAGQTIFDWTLSTTSGRVFATRNSSAINWAGINCSNRTYSEQESVNLQHTNLNDNITATFNFSGTHDSFIVGGNTIQANSCPSLNTFVSDSRQYTTFDEVLLYSDPNTVYAAIMEDDSVGYNGDTFDFQMIVPENGSASYSGNSIPYYIYVELGS